MNLNCTHQNPFRHYVYPNGREALSYNPLPNDPSPPFFGWLDSSSQTPWSKTFVSADVKITVSLMRNCEDLIWMKIVEGDLDKPRFFAEGPFIPPVPYYGVHPNSKSRERWRKGGRKLGSDSTGVADEEKSYEDSESDMSIRSEVSSRSDVSHKSNTKVLNKNGKKSNGKRKKKRKNHKKKEHFGSVMDSPVSFAQLLTFQVQKQEQKPSVDGKGKKRRGPGRAVSCVESNGFVVKDCLTTA